MTRVRGTFLLPRVITRIIRSSIRGGNFSLVRFDLLRLGATRRDTKRRRQRPTSTPLTMTMVGDDSGSVSTAVRVVVSSGSSSSNSFFTLEKQHTRARDSLLSRLHQTHYTRRRTHRGRTCRERTAWTRSYDLFLSLSLSDSLSFPLAPSTGYLVRRFAVSVLLSPSRSLARSLTHARTHAYTRTSLAFLPADAGKLSRRCQARFHPPAHKGEPKRAGQSNGVISSVGMAGVYRHRAMGNVAFSSSVRSLSVRREFERAARARLSVPPLRYGGERGTREERRGAETTANPSLPLKLEVNF